MFNEQFPHLKGISSFYLINSGILNDPFSSSVQVFNCWTTGVSYYSPFPMACLCRGSFHVTLFKVDSRIFEMSRIKFL